MTASSIRGDAAVRLGQPLFSKSARWQVAGLYALGVLVSVVAWVLASEQDTLREQIAPLNLALFGGLIAGAGNVVWVIRGRRALLLRRRHLLRNAYPPAVRRSVRGGAREAAATVVAGGQLRHFHRPGCPMVADRGWNEIPRSEVGGRKPCGVCRP